MSTALHIITRAFSKAGLRTAESPLTADEVEDGRDVLNDLLASWNANDVLTGVRLIEDVDNDTLIPREAEWAVKAKLATLLAGEYGVTVAPALAADVTESMRSWLIAKMNLSDVSFPDTLPRGSGNHPGWWWGSDFFHNSGNGKDNF